MDKVVALVTMDQELNPYVIAVDGKSNAIEKKRDRILIDDVIFPFYFFESLFLSDRKGLDEIEALL